MVLLLLRGVLGILVDCFLLVWLCLADGETNALRPRWLPEFTTPVGKAPSGLTGLASRLSAASLQFSSFAASGGALASPRLRLLDGGSSSLSAFLPNSACHHATSALSSSRSRRRSSRPRRRAARRIRIRISSGNLRQGRGPASQAQRTRPRAGASRTKRRSGAACRDSLSPSAVAFPTFASSLHSAAISYGERKPSACRRSSAPVDLGGFLTSREGPAWRMFSGRRRSAA